MQQALYHPEHGYYSSGRCAIGRKGDYFTNVSVGPLFGQLLASQFSEIWERLGKMNDFVIVEQGAHDGQFARDVLEFVQKRLPEFFDALRYRILEPFPILEQQQRRRLEAFGDKVKWPDAPEPFTGVHFSNELLDAMPVRLISDGTEKLVGLDGDKFVFVERQVDKTILNQPALDCIDEIAANSAAWLRDCDRLRVFGRGVSREPFKSDPNIEIWIPRSNQSEKRTSRCL